MFPKEGMREAVVEEVEEEGSGSVVVSSVCLREAISLLLDIEDFLLHELQVRV